MKKETHLLPRFVLLFLFKCKLFFIIGWQHHERVVEAIVYIEEDGKVSCRFFSLKRKLIYI